MSDFIASKLLVACFNYMILVKLLIVKLLIVFLCVCFIIIRQDAPLGFSLQS